MRVSHSPARGCLGCEEAREGGSDDVRAGGEDRVGAVEREIREQHLGLGGDHEHERGMRAEPRGGFEHYCDDRALEIVGRLGRGTQPGLEHRGLTRDERGDDGVLAGEVAVEGRAGAAGFAGDVVEGGLADADPGDAGDRRVEQPRAGAVEGHRVDDERLHHSRSRGHATAPTGLRRRNG